MNIDTASTLNSNNDLKTFTSASMTSGLTGNNAFKSQLGSIKSTGDSEIKTSEAKTDSKTETAKVSEEKVEASKKDEEPKKSDAKTEETSQKNDSKQENTVNNQDKGQNQQQNPQHNQNSQSESLSEEILSMMQQNGRISDINSVQKFRFVSGISEDVYTSAPAIDYGSISMSDDDAMFFATLVTKTDMSMQSIAGEFQKSLDVSNVENVQKTAKVSSALLEALSDSMKSNKAFRIDFDKDVSVVMRVDKNGNLNANFIPGDKAVEAYLRNNISYLKQRFDEQNLPYNELTYSKHKRQSQDEERRNNKESKDE